MPRSTAFSPLFWHIEAASMFARSARMMVATGETVTASAQVVGARMPIIEAAMTNPLSANLPELWLMGSEKADAFSQAQRAYWANFSSLTQSVQAYWMDAMNMAIQGKPMGVSDMSKLNDRSVAITRNAIGTGEKMLKPYHRTTTANAKRLKSKK